MKAHMIGKKRRIMVKVELWPEVAALLQEAAAERSMTIDELARFLLEKHVNDLEEEKL